MCNQSDKKAKLNSAYKILLLSFLFIVGLTCLVGLIVSICSFVGNQQDFNEAYSKAAMTIVDIEPSQKDFIEEVIEHLEKLQQIQKNAATNDVMSFLYSTLSTVLVALCAGFVAKSYNNVEKAKESAEKAKETVEKSNTFALTAEQSAKTSNDYAETAKSSASSASETSEKLKLELQKSKEMYDDAKKDIKNQRDTIQILSVHIEIIHARSALLAHDKIIANQRLYNISIKVEELVSNIDKKIISQLQQELLSLETEVDSFREYANGVSDPNNKSSLLVAADRYDSILERAVEHCQNLLVLDVGFKTIQNK